MADEQEQNGTTPAVAVTETTTTVAAVGVSEADLGKVRDLVLKANPEVVPELVKGGSIDELIASVTPAQGAYQQIADRVRAGSAAATTEAAAATTPVPPVVPAGGTAAVVDPATLTPGTKIAQALAARRK